MSLSRRSLFKASAIALAAGAVGSQAPAALAVGPALGTIIDFSAGVPSASAIKAAGHLGAIRYVSQRRPDAQWMKGKPVTLAETKANAAAGLKTASIYQFGRAETADWLNGAAGAGVHAPQAIAIHKAAGGPTGRPIYIAIDDNPTRAQYEKQIRPYLKAFSAALTAAGYQTGVYGNYNVIDWCVADGIGEFFWMHDWGSGGRIHPRTTIHQKAKTQATIDGITCDINTVYARDWGQWTPGEGAASRPKLKDIPAVPNDAPLPNISLPDPTGRGSSVDGNGITIAGSSVSNDQVRGAIDVLNTVRKAMG
ncbi:DUF1906 domain-containing protein [Corynebacterium sp. FDAARGOS 1242]|uniref:DUF1906 domain-containing protein n=1 Tax=Corynebacterium sp. FDAARGOS 1242 TaxID=2778078 RepID=UPI00194E877C|nr:DUF1906 domain-containing protein [Corynebacterium sp. FDAARGOS 1242]QRP97029.1 DUF1906 domain-containing protein [Corynebacterium sp. FDAARGOS 1242]